MAPENQAQYLAAATKRAKEQAFYMKRATDGNDLPGALKHARDPCAFKAWWWDKRRRRRRRGRRCDRDRGERIRRCAPREA